jgi:hypothetical protein
MKRIRSIFWVVASALLATYGAAAQAVNEVEPNSQISSAQPLTVDANGTVTVTALFSTGDIDFYSFEAKANDAITIDINGGMQTGLDLYVSLLGPNPFGPQQALDGNDDCNYPADIDPCIVGRALPSDGVYYVAVTHIPAQVVDNGVVLGYLAGAPAVGGSYTLTISGVTPKVAEPPAPPASEPPPAPPAAEPPPAPQVLNVQIDIRPGERAEKAVVHLARARIPVAILSSKDFDAMQIDTSKLSFGRSGDERSLDKCFAQGVDVNRDGRRDMVCLFSVEAADFEPNDVAGIVKGATTAGTQFQGRGLLKVIELHKGPRHHSDRRHDSDDDHDRGGRR